MINQTNQEDIMTSNYTAAAAELARMETRAATLAAKIAAARAELLAAHAVGEHVGQYQVIAGARRFNETLAREVLSADMIERATVSKIDGTIAKRLAPDLIPAMTVAGKPTLRRVG
jgi:hypothetical protein